MDPTTLEALATAIGRIADRLTVAALLLIVAVGFLKRWVVPRATAEELADVWKQQAIKLGNGMDTKLDQVVTATQAGTEAIERLTNAIAAQTTEAATSRMKMVEKVADLATQMSGQVAAVEGAANAAKAAIAAAERRAERRPRRRRAA